MFQSILKNKWVYLFLYEYKIQVVYTADNIAWVLAKLFAIFGSILIWSLNPSADKNYILTYLIIGNIWLELSSFTMSIRLGYEINSGKISRYLLMPSNFIFLLCVRCLGRSSVSIIQSVIILSLLAFIYKENLLFSPNLIYLLPIFIFLSVIKIMLEIIIGFLAFWFTEIQNFVDLYRKVAIFLSGNIIPLNLIPNIGAYLIYNPFSLYFYHPMQIYLNKYSNYEIWAIILICGISAALSVVFTNFVLKVGLKKNESVGL